MSMWKKFDEEHGVRTDGKIHLAPINLDSVCEEDLKLACNHPALHTSVQLYAMLLLSAIHCRKQGEIESALKIEKKCEQVYNEMPVSVRW